MSNFNKLDKQQIEVFLHQDTGLIWSSEEVNYIENRFRIVGAYVGKSPANNAEKALPYILTKEHIQLLLFSNTCVLISAEHECPTSKQIEDYENQKGNDFAIWKAQTTVYSAKMKALFLQRKFENYLVPAKPTPPISYETGSRDLLWYNTRENRNWECCLTPTDLKKFKLYRAIWNFGWFIGCGSKFGSEFILYGEDPSCCHSSVIVSCKFVSVVTAKELIGQSRIGTAVKKLHSFCSWDEKNDCLLLLSSYWTTWA